MNCYWARIDRKPFTILYWLRFCTKLYTWTCTHMQTCSETSCIKIGIAVLWSIKRHKRGGFFSINDYRKRWKINLIVCILSHSIYKKNLQCVTWHLLEGITIQVDFCFPVLINWLKNLEKTPVHITKSTKQKQQAKSNPQEINSQIFRALKNAR